MGFLDNDDHFSKHDHHHNHDDDDDFEFIDNTMEIVGGVIGFVLFALVILCIIRCCCNRNRGQVLQPPPSVPPIPPSVNNPYPQQQYVTHAAPVMYPSPNTTVITTSPAPYPAPYPHPAAAPYPAAAPFPAAAPYPPAGPAPYAGGMPQPAPYPAAMPNAPEAHALPPSYEQVMGPADSTPHAKQPPYNPYLSH